MEEIRYDIPAIQDLAKQLAVIANNYDSDGQVSKIAELLSIDINSAAVVQILLSTHMKELLAVERRKFFDAIEDAWDSDEGPTH